MECLIQLKDHGRIVGVISHTPELKEKIEEAEKDLKIMLLPRDPNDDKNVIIEIRPVSLRLISSVLYPILSEYILYIL